MSKAVQLAERSIQVGNYIVEKGATVRQAAEKFGISKTIVHRDVTIRLLVVDKELYQEVRKVLDYNHSQRAIRGGHATKKKYKK